MTVLRERNYKFEVIPHISQVYGHRDSWTSRYQKVLKSVLTSMPCVSKGEQGFLKQNFKLSTFWGMGTLQIGIRAMGCSTGPEMGQVE